MYRFVKMVHNACGIECWGFRGHFPIKVQKMSKGENLGF